MPRENPFLRQGQWKGIPYYDCVYIDTQNGEPSHTVILRQQKTIDAYSLGRYYTLIVLTDTPTIGNETFSEERLPYLLFRANGKADAIIFHSALVISPQSVMLRLQKDKLELICAADEVSLMLPKQDRTTEKIRLPSEAILQWQAVLRREL